jgi:glycosyltransferase involved in cell wall biosynthesis
MVVVHNGIDETMSRVGPGLFVDAYGLEDFVLQVGRISQYKGQVALIESLKGSGMDLVFIGDIMPDEKETRERFLALVEENEWIHYLGSMEHDSETLASAYCAAKVHALPSHSESVGNVNLEAASCGANIVTLRNEAIYEYLGDYAIYCDPFSTESIRESVMEAMGRPRQTELRERVLREFSWDKIADELIQIYERLIG